MNDFLSDETIQELLREASSRGDSLMISVCRAALFGSLDARKQLLVIFQIMNRAVELGGRIELALDELTPPELAVLRKATITDVEPN